MTEKKIKLKPSMPRRKNLQGVTRRALEFGDKLCRGKARAHLLR